MAIEHSFYCPHCAKGIELPLPVEPLYELKFVAALLPVRMDTLKSMLTVHYRHWPRRYRKVARPGRRLRLLSAGEVNILRERMLSNGQFRKRRDRADPYPGGDTPGEANTPALEVSGEHPAGSGGSAGITP